MPRSSGDQTVSSGRPTPRRLLPLIHEQYGIGPERTAVLERRVVVLREYVADRDAETDRGTGHGSVDHHSWIGYGADEDGVVDSAAV